MNEENVKENKKGKKGLIIAIIIIIIIAVIIAVGGFLFYHRQQINILTEEVNKITSIEILDENEEINKDAQIDMEIKTSGNYAVVEKTLKDYLNEVIVLSKEAENVYDQKALEDMFSAENIQTDGPEFKKSKATVQEMKQKSNEYLEKLADICNEEKLLAAIDDKNVSDYYKELYKKLATDTEASEKLKETVEDIDDTKQKVASTFDWLSKVLNFLSDNKSSWTVEDGQISFLSQTKLNEYIKLMDEAPEL